MNTEMGAILQHASQLQLTLGASYFAVCCEASGISWASWNEKQCFCTCEIFFFFKKKESVTSPIPHPGLQTSLCSSTIKDSLEVAPGVLLRVDFNGINIWHLSVWWRLKECGSGCLGRNRHLSNVTLSSEARTPCFAFLPVGSGAL